MGTYVTETGLKRKTLQEVRLEIENSLKETFGPDFETAVDSPNGLFISQLATAISNLWELALEVYVSRDPAQATGVTLDFAAALNGLFRKGAQACYVDAALFTLSEKATIAAGSKAERTRGGLLFSLEDSVAIDRASCSRLLIKDLDSKVGETYVFKFNFGEISVTATEQQNILLLLATEINIYTTGTADTLTSNPEDGLVVENSSGNVGIEEFPKEFEVYAGETGRFVADETGIQTCEIGELNSIPTAIDGWDLVYNFEAGIPGTDTESDEELRARRELSARSIKSTGTDPSIAAHLLNDVTGVTIASVLSNRTMKEDADGRPPKCFEAFVAGGNDKDVAECIWKNMPSGIQCYGNTQVVIIDENSEEQVISFSRPQTKFLWIKVTYCLYDEERFAGADVLESSILKWAEGEYTLGKDVIPDRVYSALYPPYVAGVGQAKVEVAVTDSPSDTPVYGTEIISVVKAEIVSAAAERVTLVQE